MVQDTAPNEGAIRASTVAVCSAVTANTRSIRTTPVAPDSVWTRSACDHSAIRRETDAYRTGSGATVMREPGHTAHGPCAPGPRSSEDRAAAF